MPLLIEKSERLQFKQGKASSPPPPPPPVLTSGSALSLLACLGGGVPAGVWLHGFLVTFGYKVQAVLKLLVQIQFKALPSPGARWTLGRMWGGAGFAFLGPQCVGTHWSADLSRELGTQRSSVHPLS